MGTCPSSNQTDIGIIPRAIADIFDVINNDDQWIFKVSVSFLEVCLTLIIVFLHLGQSILSGPTIVA